MFVCDFGCLCLSVSVSRVNINIFGLCLSVSVSVVCELVRWKFGFCLIQLILIHFDLLLTYFFSLQHIIKAFILTLLKHSYSHN